MLSRSVSRPCLGLGFALRDYQWLPILAMEGTLEGKLGGDPGLALLLPAVPADAAQILGIPWKGCTQQDKNGRDGCKNKLTHLNGRLSCHFVCPRWSTYPRGLQGYEFQPMHGLISGNNSAPTGFVFQPTFG